jgi:hypothetical protein
MKVERLSEFGGVSVSDIKIVIQGGPTFGCELSKAAAWFEFRCKAEQKYEIQNGKMGDL